MRKLKKRERKKKKDQKIEFHLVECNQMNFQVEMAH